jgi:uncharacterized repeat protein (TIGR03803 family)
MGSGGGAAGAAGSGGRSGPESGSTHGARGSGITGVRCQAASCEAASAEQAAGYGHAGTSRPLPQDGVSYENGPVNGTTDAWTINFGYIVSDTFVPNGSNGGGFDIYVWEFPGDKVTSVDWSVTSAPNGGTIYGSGTVSGSSLTDKFISTNQFGYDIDEISAINLNMNVTQGNTYWFNVFNAVVPSGNPVFWDENSGKGCNSPGCPSRAVESSVGTIPSEAFDITGNGVPPCFQSGGNMEIIHDFDSQKDGGSPSGGVVADPAGHVYGPMSGGQTGYGFVYQIASKNQGWVFTPLYDFTGGSDGEYPSQPIVGPEGALYGTAGGGCCGLVYSLRPAPVACVTALCSWTESVVYQPSGNNDAYNPGNLVFDPAGNLYGTSASGGADGNGAVFELTPSGGGWTETILYSFSGASDGGGPNSLIIGIDGNLYGTTVSGGGSGYQCIPYCGVVFQLLRPLSGEGWTENVIYSFTGMGDGGGPYNLAQDGLGNLLGIAYTPYGEFVTVFSLSPSSGSWVFSVVYLFSEGYFVDWGFSDLAADAAGNVYWGWGFLECYGGGECGGEAVVQVWPPGGGFSTIYNAPGLFFPSGTLGLDAHRNVYGTTADCGNYGQGTVWKVSQ